MDDGKTTYTFGPITLLMNTELVRKLANETAIWIISSVLAFVLMVYAVAVEFVHAWVFDRFAGNTPIQNFLATNVRFRTRMNAWDGNAIKWTRIPRLMVKIVWFMFIGPFGFALKLLASPAVARSVIVCALLPTVGVGIAWGFLWPVIKDGLLNRNVNMGIVIASGLVLLPIAAVFYLASMLIAQGDRRWFSLAVAWLAGALPVDVVVVVVFVGFGIAGLMASVFAEGTRARKGEVSDADAEGETHVTQVAIACMASLIAALVALRGRPGGVALTVRGPSG